MTSDTESPQAHIVEKKQFSSLFIWLLPLIALITGVWLVYKSFQDAGVEFFIYFPAGQGITANETEVRFEGVKVGLVTSVVISQDLKGVDVLVEVEKRAAGILQHDTEFWLVEPQVSISRVTGLDTLLSGKYINLQFGETTSRLSKAKIQALSAKQLSYVALDEAPLTPAYKGGMHVVVSAQTVGSVTKGAPVMYRKHRVGDVEKITMQGDGTVKMYLYIYEPYKQFVKRGSKFWNSSGIRLKGSLNSISVDVDSVTSLLVGGISFDNPREESPAAKSGAEFTLFDNRKSAQDNGVDFFIHFPAGQGVTAKQTEVRFEGVTVGLVKSVVMSQNLKGVDVVVEFDKRATGLLQNDTKFWLVEPEVSISRIAGLDTLLSGKYINLQIGEVTGRLPKDKIEALSAVKFSYVALDEAPLTPAYKGGMHVVVASPTVGSVTKGAPVMFRKYRVGDVEKISMQDDGTVKLYLYIFEPFKQFVKRDSKFWNSSGISVKGSLSSISVEVDSVTSLLIGGISFDNPPGTSPVAQNGAEYTLFNNRKSALVKNTEITVNFKAGDGLQVGALLKFNGIPVGEVIKVAFLDGLYTVQLTIGLNELGESFAKKGSRFWVVKPTLGLANTRNLSTLVTGKFITVRPGEGASAMYSFTGLESPPSVVEGNEGLKIVLQSKRLGSIKQGVKIYYRNVPVGEIDGYQLADNAQTVLMHATIKPRFAPLVRKNTKFWNISGIGVEVGLFKGAKVRADSLESLLAGGIAFATPENDEMGAVVDSGQLYTLHDEASEPWETWSPKIDLSQKSALTIQNSPN